MTLSPEITLACHTNLSRYKTAKVGKYGAWVDTFSNDTVDSTPTSLAAIGALISIGIFHAGEQR